MLPLASRAALVAACWLVTGCHAWLDGPYTPDRFLPFPFSGTVANNTDSGIKVEFAEKPGWNATRCDVGINPLRVECELVLEWTVPGMSKPLSMNLTAGIAQACTIEPVAAGLPASLASETVCKDDQVRLLLSCRGRSPEHAACCTTRAPHSWLTFSLCCIILLHRIRFRFLSSLPLSLFFWFEGRVDVRPVSGQEFSLPPR
jgi:hypothetical protein